MAAFRRGSLFIPPVMQCRHRSKINVRRPRSHYERRVYEAITQPILPIHLTDVPKLCQKMQKILKDETPEVKTLNEYEQFLVRRCKELFQENEMIIFCQPLSMNAEDQKLIRNKLFHQGIELHGTFDNFIISHSIANTKWRNLEPLLKGRNLLAFSKETNLSSLVKTLKKTPTIYILGGVADNQILTAADIQRYAAIPNIDNIRGQLVSILSTATSRTHSLLGSHQQQLACNLDQYVKDQTS